MEAYSKSIVLARVRGGVSTSDTDERTRPDFAQRRATRAVPTSRGPLVMPSRVRAFDAAGLGASTLLMASLSGDSNPLHYAAFPACAAGALVALRGLQVYAGRDGRNFAAELGWVAVALALGTASVASVFLAYGSLTVRMADTMSVWLVLSVLVLMGGRAGFPALRFWPSLRSLICPQFAVVGRGAPAHRLAASLDKSSAGRLVGVFGRYPDGANSVARPFQALVERVRRGDVDRVFVQRDTLSDGEISRLTQDLAPLAVDVLLCGTSPAAMEPGYAVATRPLSAPQLLVKDLFDRSVGLLLLLILLPVLLTIAVSIKCTSNGPVLFKQRRHGLRNQVISVYKFRSMHADMLDFAGRSQACRGDPRITPLGAFLRASSLDELPQLINVLRGEMSLVGPRPHPIDMRTEGLLCSQIVCDYDRRHRIKPGITGWAQINGSRGATSRCADLERRVVLDNHYIDNWTVGLDVRIIILTGLRLFRDENAF